MRQTPSPPGISECSVVMPLTGWANWWHHLEVESSVRPLARSLAVLLMVLTACSVFADGEATSVTRPHETDDPGNSGTTPELPTELQVCRQTELPCPGSLAEPPDDFEQVLGVVALPTSPLYPNALQTTAKDADDSSVYYFAKTGLWWRGDAAFELIVPDELRSVLAIGWGGPARIAEKVQVGCGLADSWMAQPGGYWVREPMCAQVIVRVGGSEQRVEIGLGAACPGQGPPAEPSDG